MNKQMYELSVSLRQDGLIQVIQPNGFEEPSTVLLAPEQVAIVCAWLQEAAEKSGAVKLACANANSV